MALRDRLRRPIGGHAVSYLDRLKDLMAAQGTDKADKSPSVSFVSTEKPEINEDYPALASLISRTRDKDFFALSDSGFKDAIEEILRMAREEPDLLRDVAINLLILVNAHNERALNMDDKYSVAMNHIEEAQRFILMHCGPQRAS